MHAPPKAPPQGPRAAAGRARIALALVSALVVAGTLVPAGSLLADDAGYWRSWAGPALSNHSAVIDSASHRVLLIGGGVAVSGSLPFDTFMGSNHAVWARDLVDDTGWVPLATTSPSPTLSRAAAVPDPRHGRVLVVGGDSARTAGEVRVLDLGPPAQWSRLVTSGDGPAPGPVPLAWVDDSLNTLICVRGLQPWLLELWRLTLDDTPTWSRIAAGAVPPNLFGAALVLDTRRHRLLAQGGNTMDWDRFSGSLLDGFWELSLVTGDSATWHPIVGLTGPPRTRHAACYDAVRDRFVGIGGNDGWNHLSGETWSASVEAPSDIQTISPSGLPITAANYGTFGLDRARDRLVAYTGLGLRLFQLPLDGTSGWSSADPVNGLDVNGPFSEAVLDPLGEHLVWFGGVDRNMASNTVHTLSLGAMPRWDTLTTVGTRPAPRIGASVIYDPLRARIIVHGGYAASLTAAFTDTWALSLTGTPTWTQLLADGPLALDAPSLYDPLHDAMLMFQVIGGEPPFLVHRLPLSGSYGWSVASTSGSPPSVEATAQLHSAYDPLRERWLLFRGTPNDGVWSLGLESLSWSTLPTMGVQGRFGAAYDLLGDRLVAFGGDQPVTTAMTFAGTPSVSTLAAIGPPPPPRETPWVVVDPERDALVMAGGGSSALVPRDVRVVWSLEWARLRLRLLEADTVTAAVRLRWQSGDLAGRTIELHRRQYPGGWAKLADVSFDATGALAYDDSVVGAAARYGYRLVDPLRAQPVLTEVWVGGASGSGVVVPPPAPPVRPFQVAVAPNPVIGHSLGVQLSLDAAGAVELSLIDLAGRTVARWTQARYPGDVRLDLDLPREVRPGLYWLRARLAGRQLQQRVAILR